MIISLYDSFGMLALFSAFQDANTPRPVMTCFCQWRLVQAMYITRAKVACQPGNSEPSVQCGVCGVLYPAVEGDSPEFKVCQQVMIFHAKLLMLQHPFIYWEDAQKQPFCTVAICADERLKYDMLQILVQKFS